MNALLHARTALHEDPTENHPGGTPQSHVPISVVALIRECHPATRVIIITGDDSDDVRATCLAQGANGLISKRRLYPELPRGIAEMFPDSATGSLAKGQWAQ